MSIQTYASGTLANSTPLPIPITVNALPLTITLNTTYASKLIEISTDGGVNYFTPVYDTSSANQIITHIDAPISHVRFTGTAGDLWSVR